MKLIEELSKLLAKPEVSEHLAILDKLRSDHTTDWQDLLLLSGAWPDPTPGKHDPEVVRRLVAAIDAVASSEAERRQSVSVKQTFDMVANCLSMLASKLSGLGNTADPGLAAFRVLAFVEDQSRIFHAKLQPEAGAVAVPLMALSASLPSPWGGQNVSPYQAIETTVDSAEVVLRYLAHRSGEGFSPLGQLKPATPYNDPEFHRLVAYAGLWKSYHGIWTGVKYRQYERKPGESPARFFPRHPELLLRRRIGAVRLREFELEWATVQVHLSTSDSDSPAAIQAAIRNVMGPSSWPWRFDLEAVSSKLRALCSNTAFARMTAEYIDIRS